MTARLARGLEQDLDGGFVELVDEYGSMVLSIGLRLGDPHAAEDVLQETFLRAYRSLESGASDPRALDLRPWLATIALNLVRNEGRRRARRRTVRLDAGEAGAGEAGAGEARVGDCRPDGTGARRSEVEEQVTGRIAEEALTTALESISARQREVVVLRHVVGLSTRETAEATGRPAGTVKSDLARGLAALRERLTDPRTEAT